jgi:hypothetical protein
MIKLFEYLWVLRFTKTENLCVSASRKLIINVLMLLHNIVNSVRHKVRQILRNYLLLAAKFEFKICSIFFFIFVII